MLITALIAVSMGVKAQSISLKNEKYEMGKITYGKPVEYTVELTNTGKDTLTLETARAGCGCTTPNFTPNQKFGPGETVKILIQFNGSVLGTRPRGYSVSCESKSFFKRHGTYIGRHVIRSRSRKKKA